MTGTTIPTITGVREYRVADDNDYCACTMRRPGPPGYRTLCMICFRKIDDRARNAALTNAELEEKYPHLFSLKPRKKQPEESAVDTRLIEAAS